MFRVATRNAKRKIDDAQGSGITPNGPQSSAVLARPGKRVKFSAASNKEADDNAQKKLENMFEDFDDLWQKIHGHEESISWETLDPLRDFRDWPIGHHERLREAIAVLGLEFAVVAMWSETFVAALRVDEDSDWNRLTDRVASHKEILRTFAITHNIRYLETYQNSFMPQLLKPLADFHPMAATAEQRHITHPHLFYEAHNGDIRPVRFIQETINRAMCHFDANLYIPERMERGLRPKSWPKKWDFPWDPTTANQSKDGPYGPCWGCQKPIVSWSQMKGVYPHCTCLNEEYIYAPLVEIRELSSYIEGIPNRGVIALSPIEKSTLLAEYTGTYIHLDTEEEDDDTYAFELTGPQVLRGNSWGFLPNTCRLSAADGGNWTRFMNHSDVPSERNVLFKTEALSGRLRILALSTRDIKMGEELRVDYGPKYFTNEEATEVDAVGDFKMGMFGSRTVDITHDSARRLRSSIKLTTINTDMEILGRRRRRWVTGASDGVRRSTRGR